MDINNFKSFVDISETLSFSKTAEKSFITQTAISHRIREIEDVLGCPLFIRTNKGVKLTQEGEMFLPYAINILKNYDNGIEIIHSHLQTRKKSILIGSITPAINVFLAPAIGEFCVKFPDITIEVQKINPLELRESISQRSKDIYISDIDDLMRNDDWNICSLVTDPFVLIIKEGIKCTCDKDLDSILRSNKIYTIPDKYSPTVAKKSRQILDKLKIFPLQIEEMYPVESIMFSVASGIGVAVLPQNIFVAMQSFGLTAAKLNTDEHINLSMGWRKDAPDYVNNFTDLMVKKG